VEQFDREDTFHSTPLYKIHNPHYI
jgi:hypothetical protein